MTREGKSYKPDKYPFRIDIPNTKWACGIDRKIIGGNIFFKPKCYLGIEYSIEPTAVSQKNTESSTVVSDNKKKLHYLVVINNCKF